MSLRIMSDVTYEVSSSDEEIFVSSPLTKSTNTSINSISSVNKQTINNDCAIKDVSVKITQLPMIEEFKENKKNTHRDNKIKKKKRVIRKWQKGIITKKKDRRAKAVASVENKAEEHRQDQLRIIEEHPTDVHQKLRQIAQSSLASLEIPVSKEDTKVDRTYTSARILPYNFYQKDTSRDAETCFNSSSYLSESTEQLSHGYETSLSEETSSLKDAQLQRLQEVHYKVLELKIEKCFPKKLDEQIDKTNDGNESDSSMGLQPVLKKRRRRISSSESENRIDNNNCSKSYLPCEETEQAESRTNMQITRKLRVTLMRIEDMINMSIVKQNREDALTISKSSVTEQQSSTEKARKLDTGTTNEEVETRERQNNKVISAENNGLSRTEDISEDSKLLQLSDTRLQRNCLKQLDDLYIKKLKKKYKLFKKPRVLLIRLETLQVFVRNGNYSASEVERLMKKYIDFVIKSNCLFTSRAIRFKQLRNESTDVDIAHTASVSSQSATNDSTEFAEKSPTKDDKITENNNVKKSSLVKFPCRNFMSMIPIDQYKLLQSSKDKSSVSPEKKRENLNFPSSQELLKIWQNAFCNKSTGKTQKTTAKQSVSSQSASEVPSVSQSPSKKSADTKCRDVSNSVASTSLSPAKRDTPAVSPKKVVSPNKQAAERNENVHELSPKCITLSSNERVGETVSKTDSPSLENKEILRSLLDSIKGNVVSSRPSLNLARKVTEKASPKSLEKLSPKSQEKSSSKSPGKSSNITSPVGEVTSPKISRVPWLSCETTQITFKCAKCNKTFEHFRVWQEHQNVCKKNTIVDSSSSNVPKQQTSGSLNSPMPQKSSGNTTSKPSSYKLTFEKCDKVCTVCSRNFDNNFEFYEHLKKHTDNPHKKVYSIFKTAFTSQKTDKQSEQASISMSKKPVIVTAKTVKIPGNEVGDRLLDNTNRSNAERRVTSEVSQQDASMQTRNETSTISGTTERNRQKQSSIFATRETEENDEERSLSPVAICKCHRNVKVVHGENVPIEIVLQCTCCHVLFRLLECFEAHCKSSALPSCANNSQNNRKARLFCNICQVMMNSLKDMYRHLVTHAKINRKGTVTFRCNICKVAFYGLGPLFNDHYGKHEKSSCFKSTRLDFPAATYVGSRLIRMPTADNDKKMSLYYEVADHMCPKCKTPFYTPLTLRIHIVTCQGNVGAVDNDSASSSDMKITSAKKKFILICGFCNRKFYNKAVFEHHSSKHKQKRELSSYYTFVSVTAVTKVFICKICTSVRQSLESFEEHWRTHGELREDYVCSICENHFDTFDLFEKHAVTHEKSVLCKVIYRDTNEQTSATSPHGQERDNPSSEDHREKSEKSASDKVLPITGSRESVKKRLFENKEPEVITVPDITERVPPADITRSPGARKDSATNRAKDCPTIDENAGSNFNSENNNNNDNLEDSDEENLVIALSDDESTVSTTIGNTVADNVPLVDHNDTGKRAANSVATAEQRKSTDMESVVSFAETSGITNVTSGSSNGKLDDVITRKEVATRLNASADVSGNKETCVGDTNVGGSRTGRDGCANDAVVHPVIVDVVSLNENPKEMPKSDVSAGPKELPKNDKSTENKTFLRVRSLAELTNTPLKSHVCYKCGQPFDCVRKLTEHITQHDAEQRKQVSSLGNVQRQPTYFPILPKQAPNFAPRPKAPPPYPANSNPIQQRTLSSTSRQYQHGVPWTSQRKSTSAAVPQPLTVQQSTGPISEVSYPANNFVQQQTISVQQQQQQQSASTVAVRPFMQNFNQGSVSTPVLYQQHQLQQQPQLQQLYPHHRHHHQQQLLLQQHRLQQQQQHNNVVRNQYLRSQRKVSNPLAQSNTMPANTANNVNTSGNPNMAQQMTKTPEHLACLYCPGFKCVSITDFAAHLRSPKHEARSHYNDVPYMP